MATAGGEAAVHAAFLFVSAVQQCASSQTAAGSINRAPPPVTCAVIRQPEKTHGWSVYTDHDPRLQLDTGTLWHRKMRMIRARVSYNGWFYLVLVLLRIDE